MGTTSVAAGGKVKAVWCVAVTVLTFFTCDWDENNGADAQKGERDDELNTGATRIVKAEAGQVDEEDDRGIEH